MHLFHPLARRGRLRAGVYLSLSLVAASFLIDGSIRSEKSVAQLFQPRIRRTQPVQGQDASAGVYLPTDRTQSRAISRARERLADHEYHEVLAFLQEVLTKGEDSFLERSGDERQQLGLKATAR